MIVTRSLLPLVIAALSSSRGNAHSTRRRAKSTKGTKSSRNVSGSKTSNDEGPSYEVWGSDQSNSVTGESLAGVRGSYLWIWDSYSVERQLTTGADAIPLGCAPDGAPGPCDLLAVFPPSLIQVDAAGNDLGTLGNLPKFGRLHGMLKDPAHRYVTASIFAPGGGYIGVIDAATKGAVGLFRVGSTDATGAARSVHMSFWSADGSAVIVNNLHGKMIERIDVERDGAGSIVGLSLDQGAGVYLGKDFALVEGASYFRGPNAFGDELVGDVVGSYDDADIGDLTPSAVCKESGCLSGSGITNMGGARTNNVPICPIPSSNNNSYVTMGSGGLFVLKLDQTPMKIVAEYGNAIVNGAGCGGTEAGDNLVFLNAGVSASGAGATQSTFTLYAFEDSKFDADLFDANPKQNLPHPIQVFKDPTNTNSIGNVDGIPLRDTPDQLPASTTRRDSHGQAVTTDGKYLHVVDRLQNKMEVFDTGTFEHVGTYDLVSADGRSGRGGRAGPCLAKSVLDDPLLQRNDPTPDLCEITPDGRYIMVGLRGPKPVSVAHAAQGSCPGVGVVEITEGGRSGRLVDVLRSMNTVDTVAVGVIPGGTDYAGAERSDIHAAMVIRSEWSL